MHDQQGEVLAAVAARAAAMTAFDQALALDQRLGWAVLGRAETRLRQARQMRAAGLDQDAAEVVTTAREELHQAQKLGPTPVRTRARELLGGRRP